MNNLIRFSELPGFSEFAVVFDFESLSIKQQFNDAIKMRYEKLCKTKAFEGKLMQNVQLQDNGKTILIIGLGKKADFDNEFIRRGTSLAYKIANAMKINKMNIFIPRISANNKEMAQAITEGAVLASYSMDKYKTGEGEKKPHNTEVFVHGKNKKEIVKGISIGKITGNAQNYVRELNENPSNIITPRTFSEEAKTLAKQYKMKIEILEKNELEKKGMNGILAVGKGSANDPIFVSVEYSGTKRGPLYVIVGKGITFDSGGISIKPAKSMYEMKYDKTGACIVLGVLKAIAEMKLPVRILGIIPLAENVPSGTSYKPGDIIKMYSGKTVEILHTDAEGRLILGDALTFAIEKKPEVIIDIATLTGAIITALGRHAIGLFSNNDKLAEKIKLAGNRTFERVWQFPLWKEYSEMIQGDFADIKNSSGNENNEASSITAAAFLKEFVGETKWAHLDIAGVCNAIGKHPLIEKGATGTGTRLIIQSIIELSKKEVKKDK